nr:ATP-binding protein [Pseudenhygromyxa sp. WMMC2535]
MQARLQEARKLEAVSRLAGGIAHDFNNLLMSILGTVELMRLDAEDPALQADLDQITTDGERAAALTKQLLTFARTKQARAEPVELDAVVREAVELLRHRPDSGIELVLDLELDARCVRGVPASLRELVLDLAFNARDAMPEGGSLTISTRAEAAPASGEPQLVLRVSDTGEGMTPEVAERAFEPFFTTKELGKGSGLGLAAAYGVVRSHGGEISTHSSPGLGTTFEVRLPELAAPCKPERDLANLGPRFAAPGLVLLVDDSAGPRQVASRLLSRLGFEVMAAPDGPTALDLLRARSDELRGAVLDVRMPGMNGVETLRRLRELNPELPVVMASGYADPEHLDELATLGVHDVLRKPYTLDELGGALARVLASA